MKKIVGLILALVLIIGLVGAGTYAYFSDTESSVDNTLTAGTLDLNIEGGDIAITTFDVSNVAPGDNGTASSTLANVGSLVGELDIATSGIDNVPGSGGEFGGGSGELGANAEIAIYLDIDQTGTRTAGDVGLQSNGTTYDPTGGLNYDVIDNYANETWNAVVAAMAASAQDDIIILWDVPTDTGNDVQGDSVSFNVTFTLEQAAAD